MATHDLQSGWDGDDLLDRSVKSFDVIVPIENLSDVEILHRVVLKVFQSSQKQS